MIPQTRSFAGAILAGLAMWLFLLGVGAIGMSGVARAAGRADPQRPSPVSLQVSVGYYNIYRGTSWTPIHVTLHNAGRSDVSGHLKVPQSDQSASVGASYAFGAVYQAPITIPAGTTRHVTVYVPGSGIQGRLTVSLVDGRRILATSSSYPTGVDSGTLLIGTLSGSPADSAWIAPAIQRHVTTHIIPLTAASLDSSAQALGAFDIIALTNVDTSQLDGAQIGALESYVHSGGALLIVGGPAWQQTLRPLPAALLPGKLAGSRVLGGLHGLLALGSAPRASVDRSSVVSVLTEPKGIVWARQGGVPLVVREQVGQGAIDYLAFDPAVNTLPAGGPLVEHLVSMAAPVAISRTWSPTGFRARFDALLRTVALTTELGNVPPSTLPLLVIFAGLTLAYVLIVGPLNFLVLRRLERQHLALITLPTLALVYLGAMSGIAAHLKGSAVILNSVGVIILGHASGAQPDTMYLSLSAPLPGTYHLAYGGGGLPSALPSVTFPNGFSPRGSSTISAVSVGMDLQEDPGMGATFLSMGRWTTRALMLDTSMPVHGMLQSHLSPDAHGNIAGTIHNGTSLALQNPIILSGQSVTYVPAIGPGATLHVHLKPATAATGSDPTSVWSTLYGGSGSSGFDGLRFGDFGGQVAFATEHTMRDRERNAMSMLARARALPSPKGLLLIAWNDRSLGTFTVDGAAPQRRDLNLVLAPLSVHLPAHGAFRLRPGVVAAHLVDIVPRAPVSTGYGFGGPDSPQQISVGVGGSVTFEFDLPVRRHVSFRQLAVSAGGGTDGLGPGRVYDWRQGRWVRVDLGSGSVSLPSPNRFVSPQGQVLVELPATNAYGGLSITDQYHAVDLSGAGAVS